MTSTAKGEKHAMRTRMTIIALALVVALATSAAPAIAQSSPQQDAYGGVIAEVVTPSKPKPQQKAAAKQAPVAATQPTQSALPFTGLQVTLVLLAGAALLGTGLVLRRATGSKS
jgi:hypothetical protein